MTGLRSTSTAKHNSDTSQEGDSYPSDVLNNDTIAQIYNRERSDLMKEMKEGKKLEGQKHLTTEQTVIQALKFVLFSAGAGIIQFVSFTLLQEVAHLPYWPAYLPAVILSVLFNFTVNRKFTFKSANNVPIAMIKVACFYVVFIPLSTWWGDALTEQAGWNDYLVLAFTMVINFVTEFLYDRFFVFGKSINTNDLGLKERKKMEQDRSNIGKTDRDKR